MQQEQPTKVKTGVVRLSFAHLFHPKAVNEGDKPKYSVSLLIDKSDKATLKAIESAINAAKELGKDKQWGGKIPANIKLPLRDGDEERPDDENYAGKMFINCSSDQKPGIIDRRGNEITEEDEVYSGCFARVSLNLFPFNKNGNKGVAAGLNNLMKWEDGEALAGRASATSDFADVIDEGADDLL